MLPILRTQNKLRKNKDLYLQSDYNFSSTFTNPECSLKPTVTRIFNALVKELNDAEHLPKYIIMILDKDILETLDTSKFNPKKLIRAEVYWLQQQVSKYLLARRENLRNHRPGAITIEETCVIWVKMLARPLSQKEDLIRILKLRRKFNDLLDELCRENDINHTMMLTSVNEYGPFDISGDLTCSGQTQFWIEVNNNMKLFDYHQIELKPLNKKAEKIIEADENSQTPKKVENPLSFTTPVRNDNQEKEIKTKEKSTEPKHYHNRNKESRRFPSYKRTPEWTRRRRLPTPPRRRSNNDTRRHNDYYY